MTRHGKEVAVVLSKAEYDKLSGNGEVMDFKEFLRSGPDLSELDLERQKHLPREIELDF